MAVKVVAQRSCGVFVYRFFFSTAIPLNYFPLDGGGEEFGSIFLYFRKSRCIFFTVSARSMKKLWSNCLSWSLHCKNACWCSAKHNSLCSSLEHVFPWLTCLVCEHDAWIREGFLNTPKSSCRCKEELGDDDFPGSNTELVMQCWTIELGLCVGQCHGQVEQCLHF